MSFQCCSEPIKLRMKWSPPQLLYVVSKSNGLFLMTNPSYMINLYTFYISFDHFSGYSFYLTTRNDSRCVKHKRKLGVSWNDWTKINNTWDLLVHKSIPIRCILNANILYLHRPSIARDINADQLASWDSRVYDFKRTFKFFHQQSGGTFSYSDINKIWGLLQCLYSFNSVNYVDVFQGQVALVIGGIRRVKMNAFPVYLLYQTWEQGFALDANVLIMSYWQCI